jgi:hypothetical protein
MYTKKMYKKEVEKRRKEGRKEGVCDRLRVTHAPTKAACTARKNENQNGKLREETYHALLHFGPRR